MITPIYSSFNQAQQQISDLAAIDYFFAKEILLSLAGQKLSQDQQGLAFHLFIALSDSLRQGHTCLPLSALAKSAYGFASDEQGLVTHHGFTFPDLDQLHLAVNDFAIEPNSEAPIVYHQAALYLRRYFLFEQQVSQDLMQRMQGDTAYQQQDIHQCISQLFPQASEEIDWQQLAVANAINKGFSIIAGGPGTGKTYTVVKLLAALVMLEQQGLAQQLEEAAIRIALVAPTGKAAQRLSESVLSAVKGFRGQIDDTILDALPNQAQTLHRLLGVLPNQANFKHHQFNKLALDVLLIDEVSMVDLALMNRLLLALPAKTKVILLGDADQLPSVAAGSVLADIAPRPHMGFSRANLAYLSTVTGYKALPKAKKQPADHLVILTKSRRFDGQGGIGLLAQAVIAGQSQESWQLLAQDNSQLHLLSMSLSTWLPKLVEQYYQAIFRCTELSEAFLLLSRFRILSATHKGEYGVENINKLVVNLLQRRGFITDPNSIFHGQPIMISENDYGIGLFNGDIGLIWRHPSGHLMAVFEDNSTAEQDFNWLMPSRLPKFTTVYAMTIHKTQGSEFEHVAMILPQQSDNKLLSRELLYTGITRAKTELSIASPSHVWRQGVEAKVQRYSGLSLDQEIN